MDNANQEQKSSLVLTVIVVLGLALGCVSAVNGGDYPFNNPLPGIGGGCYSPPALHVYSVRGQQCPRVPEWLALTSQMVLDYKF
ncbi:hypothetical protein GBA52_004378 [Prunus armeniaca]|nr:hypothetical protein GBA52_004378 [Prunus armeniaca]